MSEVFFLGSKNRQRYLKLITPVGNFFVRVGVHPNVLTVTGFIISLFAGLVYAGGSFFWGACCLVFAGICDTLDGQIARQSNKQSRLGAFFDSTMDRYSDIFPLAGMAYYFSGGMALLGMDAGPAPSPLTIIAIIMTIAGSFMVSYTRARAEGLGVACNKGIMQRPERITFLIMGSFLGSIPIMGLLLIKCTLVVLAVLTNATALSRMAHTRRQLLAGKGDT